MRSPVNNSKRNLIFVAILLALLLLPLKGSLSDLQALPESFFGRKQLITWTARLRYRLLDDQLFNHVLRSDEGWLVYSDEHNLADYQKSDVFTEAQLAQIQTNLTTLQQQLAQEGIRLYVIIPPNKDSIYPEKVPAEIPVIGSQSRLEQLVSYLQPQDGFPMLDLRPALLAARQHDPVYYATDTHWNATGSYVAYRQIADLLAKDFPMIIPHDLSEYQQASQTYSGDLNRIAGDLGLSEQIITLNPTFSQQVTQTETVENDIKILITETSDPNLPRAVIFRDSFFESIIPSLSTHFSRSVNVWSFAYDPQLVAREKPDLVIFECTERYLQFLLYLP